MCSRSHTSMGRQLTGFSSIPMAVAELQRLRALVDGGAGAFWRNWKAGFAVEEGKGRSDEGPGCLPGPARAFPSGRDPAAGSSSAIAEGIWNRSCGRARTRAGKIEQEYRPGRAPQERPGICGDGGGDGGEEGTLRRGKAAGVSKLLAQAGKACFTPTASRTSQRSRRTYHKLTAAI